MSDHALTQIGLGFVYTCVGILLLLTDRVEPSKSLRVWALAFLFFAANAVTEFLGYLLGKPELFHSIALIGLIGASVAGVAGIVTFIGGPFPKPVFVLATIGALTALTSTVLPLGATVTHFVVMSCVGLSFLWSGKHAFQCGEPSDVGRWVACSAMVVVGIYAFLWPLLFDVPWFMRIEFFLDLSLVMWGAAGALLMHFERSRERIRDLAAKELELRAQLERAERLDALGRLAGGVAHDFNNVLTTVIHGSELALKQLHDPSKATQHLELVLDAARGAASFTRQLLALGRRRLPGRKPIRLVDAIHSATAIVRPSTKPSHRLLLPAVADDLTVLAGEGQIEQVLVNLYINALDAMPDGGTLELRVQALDTQVVITVTDTGCGMSEDTLSRVFEPFFGTKTERGGSGLGLTAVYAIVKQLDGQIEVASTQGAGSSFTLQLPRHLSNPALTPEPSQSSPRPADSVRILVVDDQEAVLKSLSGSLERLGYRVCTAQNADEALRVIENTAPALLLTDVRMPGQSGIELVSKVRQKLPKLPVVMMTGFANDDVESSRLRVCWLLKPFTPEKLQTTIAAAIGT